MCMWSHCVYVGVPIILMNELLLLWLVCTILICCT